jgi:hypothetical protein
MLVSLLSNPVAMPGPKGRRPWSTMLLREYAAKAYAGYPLLEQFRLGPTQNQILGVPLTAPLERALRVSNWFADGVIPASDKTVIIEAKIRPNPSAIGQVLYYLRLALQTPLLQSRLNLPVEPVVLFAESDASVENFARSYGVRVATYTPAWIMDYLQSVQLRGRGPNPPESTPAPGEGNGSPEG